MSLETRPELEVEIRLKLYGIDYKSKAKICLCPFCTNLEPERSTCGMCDGSGLIIKLKESKLPLKLIVIPGGKS
jgi:hypothetical protein